MPSNIHRTHSLLLVSLGQLISVTFARVYEVSVCMELLGGILTDCVIGVKCRICNGLKCMSRSLTPIFVSMGAMLCVYLFLPDVCVSAGWMLCIPDQLIHLKLNSDIIY